MGLFSKIDNGVIDKTSDCYYIVYTMNDTNKNENEKGDKMSNFKLNNEWLTDEMNFFFKTCDTVDFDLWYFENDDEFASEIHFDGGSFSSVETAIEWAEKTVARFNDTRIETLHFHVCAG